MTEPTERERRELNERLARAMGWRTKFWESPEYACPRLSGYRLFRPDGSVESAPPAGASEALAWSFAPDFTRDPAASRELVLWLAAGREKWERFVSALVPVRLTFTSTFMSVQEWAAMVNQVASALMTADPLLIARAAREAIGGKDGR